MNIEEHSFTEQDTFDSVITSRIVLVYSALKITNPTFEQTLALAIALGTKAVQELDGVTCPFHGVNWTMYYLDPNEDDPIERVHMAEWAVEGVVSASGNRNFDFGTIDPQEWTRNIEEVMDSMPPMFGNALVRAILDCVRDGVNNEKPEDVALVREAIAAKSAVINTKFNGNPHVLH